MDKQDNVIGGAEITPEMRAEIHKVSDAMRTAVLELIVQQMGAYAREDNEKVMRTAMVKTAIDVGAWISVINDLGEGHALELFKRTYARLKHEREL